ncbi:MAG: DMT family transporter [Pseudomonadota bacterium]
MFFQKKESNSFSEKSFITPYFLLGVYCFLWAAKDVYIAAKLEDYKTLEILVGSSFWASLVAIILFSIRKRSDAPNCIVKLRWFMLIAVFSCTAFLAMFSALKELLPATYAVIDTAIYPTSTILLALLFMGERITTLSATAILLLIVGSSIFMASDNLNSEVNPVWYIVASTASFAFAVSALAIKKLQKEARVGNATIALARYLPVFIIFTFIYIFSFQNPDLKSVIFDVNIMLLGIFGLLVPMLLLISILGDIPLSHIGVATTSIPFFSYALSLSVGLGFHLTNFHWLGLVVLMLGWIILYKVNQE